MSQKTLKNALKIKKALTGIVSQKILNYRCENVYIRFKTQY